MTVLRRAVLITSIVGALWATTTSGIANPTITFRDCSTSNPAPTGTPPSVTGAPVSPPPVTSPSPSPRSTPIPQRTPGPDNCTPSSGSVVFGTQTLGFTVTSDGFQPIKNVKLSVLADNDPGAQNAAEPLFNDGYDCNNQPSVRNPILVPWDTAADTPHNGHYKVVVTADTYANPTCGSTGRSQTATRSNIIVDNPPDTPAAPVVIATTPTAVTIQWTASTAPDVIRYGVYRAEGSSTKQTPQPSTFHLIGYTQDPTFRDTQVSAGVYWYAIVVTRKSVVTPKTGISSAMSAPSAPVTVAAAPPPASFNTGSGGGSTVQRYFPINPLVLPPSSSGGLAPVPDAPYSAQLPYGNAPEGGVGAAANNAKNSEPGAADPRGPVLPVAVGAFLVSAALALGRMPY